MAAIRKVVVYDSVMYNRGHNVRRWAEAVERRFTRYAIEEAPMSTRPKAPNRAPAGHLKSSISGVVTRPGPRRLVTRINVGAYYATYVLRGTGPIIDAGGKPMKIWNAYPTPKEAGPYFFRRAVAGQPKNDFLGRAHDRTALRHPSLRGVNRGTIAGGR